MNSNLTASRPTEHPTSPVQGNNALRGAVTLLREVLTKTDEDKLMGAGIFPADRCRDCEGRYLEKYYPEIT